MYGFLIKNGSYTSQFWSHIAERYCFRALKSLVYTTNIIKIAAIIPKIVASGSVLLLLIEVIAIFITKWQTTCNNPSGTSETKYPTASNYAKLLPKEKNSYFIVYASSKLS